MARQWVKEKHGRPKENDRICEYSGVAVDFRLSFIFATFDLARSPRAGNAASLSAAHSGFSRCNLPLFRPFSIYVTKTHSYVIAHAGLNALSQRIRIIKRTISRRFRAHLRSEHEIFPRKKKREKGKQRNREMFGRIASLGIDNPWDAGTRRTKNRKWVNRIGPIR